MHKAQSLLGRGASSWICESCLTRLARGQKAEATCAFSTSSKQSANPTRRPKLPDTPARTRFAPSPTGNLHLGSIRTALFNYFLARRTGGQFLLRVEDTDQKRTIPGAEQGLFRDLRWAGLHWDEGPEVGGPYGPYRQSERLVLYQNHIKTLLQNRKAYRCFCSADRIDTLNRLRHDKGLPLGYDRKCIDIPQEEAEDRAAKGESHVVRFHVPKEYPKYNDLVYGTSGHGAGKAKQHLADEPIYDDPILIKSDKFPTYHFANVVDDKLMEITHVIRGSEWMSSTPLHVALYNAFHWDPPQYGHVPLLVDANRQKLSKRNFDSDISSFRDKQGIFPEALTNFAALLGWSHQRKNDVMDLPELENIFDLKITKGNTMVAFEKLNFLQEQHARRRVEAGGEHLEQMIRDVAVELLNKYGATAITKFIGKRSLRDVIATLLRVRSLPYRNAQQFVASADLFFSNENIRKRQPLHVAVPDVSLYPNLRVAATTFFYIPQEFWNRDTLRDHISQLQISDDLASTPEEIARAKAATGTLYAFLRWALLGTDSSPDAPSTMEILGRDVCESRIREAVLVAREVENQLTTPTIRAKRVPKGEGNSKWQAHSLPQSASSTA